jgi:carbamoyl-phosphate synthase large subunit
MKILLVGAGRRYSFVERLQREGFQVASLELDKNTPISRLCEIIPASGDWDKDREFVNELTANNLAFILPLNDKATFEFATCPRLIGHDKLVAETCYDKSVFHDFMMVHFPDIFPKASYGDNLIIKPRFGCSSKGVREDVWKYESWVNYDMETEVIQRKIEGVEYSVDTYFTKQGVFTGAVPRTRERVAGGEVIDSRTVYNELLIDTTRIIGNRLSMTGPACFQYIIDKGTGKPYLFEINARFGGGNILSLEAGFNMIGTMRWEYWNGFDLVFDAGYAKKISWGLLMRRVNREIFFNA